MLASKFECDEWGSFFQMLKCNFTFTILFYPGFSLLYEVFIVI